MSDDGAPNEREQRLQALRSLAHEQASQEAPRAPASAPSDAGDAGDAGAPHGTSAVTTFSRLRQETPARRSRWLRVGVGVTVVALLVALGIALVRSLTPHVTSHASAAAVVVTPQSDGAACPAGAAWSPDGRAIAVIGYQTQCPDSDIGLGNEPGKLIIYETRKGRIVANVTLSPDTLAQKIGVPLATQVPQLHAQPHPTILYDTPIWSPDGKRIVIPFVVDAACFCLVGQGYQFDEVGAPMRVGLLELSATGKLEAALSAPYSAAQQSVEWDVERQALAPNVGQLAPAQTYTWSGARLSPISPLGAPPRVGPIGDPQRAATISLWQTGWAGPVILASAPTPTTNGNSLTVYTPVPDVLMLAPTFAAWSPDGRYLLLPNFSLLVLTPGGRAPERATLQPTGLGNTQQVAPRDAALASLFAAYAQQDKTAWGMFSSDALAWSPDGKLLAVAGDLQVLAQPQNQPVTLLDTRTGKVVATLTPADNTSDSFGFNPNMQSPAPLTPHLQLAWSSDGSRLLLLNPALGAITIWTVKR
jgi:WD40 repeat protein